MAKFKNQPANLRNNQSGFVIIIALGMILILSIFAIIIQQTTINTLRSMKESENLFSARVFAESTMEYLGWIVKNNGGAGITTGKIVCAYGSYNESSVTVGANSGAAGSGNSGGAEGGGQS